MRWVSQAGAFTLAGVVSSSLVGYVLGWLGDAVLVSEHSRALALTGTSVFAGVCVARELGLVRFPLPELKRQTQRVWGFVSSPPAAAAMWGFDIGFVVTTWLTFSGVVVLLVAAIAIGNPFHSAALMLMYWLGRALPVWLAPIALSSSNETRLLLRAINAQAQMFHRVHIVGVIWLGIGLVVLLLNR